MSYQEHRKECAEKGYIKHSYADRDVLICGLNRDRLCSGHDCPSKHYWSKSPVKNDGKNKWKAIERAGLRRQYDEEIGVEECEKAK